MLRYPWALCTKEEDGQCVILKMLVHLCVSRCGCFLTFSDGQDHCLSVLGHKHAETMFVDFQRKNRPQSSEDDDSAKLPPSGVVTKSESDPELKAMLSQAAENIRLE